MERAKDALPICKCWKQLRSRCYSNVSCLCIADLASQAGLFSRPHYIAEKLAYVGVGMLSVLSDAKK